MKRTNIIVWVAMLFTAALVLQNCAKEELSDPIEIQKDLQYGDVSLDEVLLEADYLLENPEIDDATESSDMEILNDGIPYFLEDDDRLNFDGLGTTDALRKHRCDSLWIKLALTDTQKTQLRRAHTAYMACKIRAQSALKQLYQSYFKRAAAERAKLIQAYKNGRITRAQLVQKLQNLNKKVRAAIQADPQRKALIKILKDCHAKYYRTLKSILTPQQWSLLMKCKWVLYKRGGKGGGTTGGGKTVYNCPTIKANYGDLCKDALGNVGRINRNCKCDTTLVGRGGGTGTGGGNTGGGGRP